MGWGAAKHGRAAARGARQLSGSVTIDDLTVTDDVVIDANGIIPVDDDDLPLGSASKRFSDFHAMQGTVYGAFTLSGTGADLDVQGTGTSSFAGSVDIGGPTTGGSAGLRVLDTSGRIVALSSNSDAATKVGRFGVAHYTNAEEPHFGVNIQSTSSDNVTDIGGGTSIGNAATLVRVYTAANNTTVTGTLRGSVSSTGKWTIGEDLDPNTQTHVIQGASLRLLNRSDDAQQKFFAIVGQPYTTTDGDWRAISLRANGANNVVEFGGSTADSPTLYEFYTASALDASGTLAFSIDSSQAAAFTGDVSMAAQTTITIGVYTNAQRPAAGTAGRVIFNSDDGQLNIDDGTNWTLPDGTTT